MNISPKLKYLLYAVPAIAIGLFFATQAIADNPNFWLLSSNKIKPLTSTWDLQVTSTAGDSANTANGVIHYNSSTDRFRCYQAGSWQNCIGSSSGGGAGAGWSTSTPNIVSNNFGDVVGVNSNTPWSTLVVQGTSTQLTNILTVASSTGKSLLSVAQNGSTTLSSLGTGFVKSSSGSLFTDTNTYLTGNQSISLSGAVTGSGATSIATVFGVGDFATGTTGNIFNIATTTTSLTINLPTASASNSGQLSSTDWNTFNGKQAAGSYLTGINGDVSASGPGNAGSTVNGIGNKAISLATGYLKYTGTAWTFDNSTFLTSVTADSPLTGSGTSGSHLGVSTGNLSLTSSNLSFGSGDGKLIVVGTSTNITLTDNPTFTKGIFTNASTTNFTASGNVFLTGLTSQSCIGTAASGLLQAGTCGGSGSVSGGTTGFVTTWASSTGLTSGTLRDNGTVAGQNATSSTVSFNLQGGAGLTPFVIASSSGTTMLNVTQGGNIWANDTGSSISPSTAVIGGLNFYSNNDPLTDTGNRANYALNLQNYSVTNSSSTGLSFAVTTDVTSTGTVGGAIVFKRTASNSKGELDFYNKQSTAAVAPVLAMSIADNGSTTISSLGTGCVGVSSGSLYTTTCGGGSSITFPISYASSTATTTTVIYGDVNRGDTYTPNGSIVYPYKSIATMIAASSTLGNGYYLAPGTYVSGAPDTWQQSAFTLQGNEATYVPASGVTLPGSFDIFDLTISGNVTESDNSLTFIHQFNNGVINGNLTTAGLATLSGMALTSSTSAYTILAGSLNNFVGSISYGNIIDYGISNLNDANVQVSQNNPNSQDYAFYSSSTGAYVNVNGLSLLNTAANGGGFYLQNGATSSPNIITNAQITVNSSTAGSTINCGTSACVVGDVVGLSNLSGVFVAPTGSNWKPLFDEQRSVLNGLSVGTSTFGTYPFQVANTSTGASYFSVGANGSTTVNTLTTGIVQSTSGGSLYVVPAATYQAALTNPDTGTGVSGQVTVWSGATALTGDAGFLWSTSNHTLSINSSTPNATLVVQGSSTAPTLDVLRVASSSNSTLFNVTSAGNVGINSTSPGTLLTIQGSPGSTAALLTIASSSGATILSVTPINPTSAASFLLNVASTSGASLLTVDGFGNTTLNHLIGSSTLPTVATSTGIGSTAGTSTVMSGSTDLAGWINILTGATPAANATIATLTFNRSFTKAPFCQVTNASSTTSTIWATTTATTLVLKSNSSLAGANADYDWYYQCVGQLGG